MRVTSLFELFHKWLTLRCFTVSTKNFIDFSCLVVAVLSHGEEKNLISAKDMYYDFDDTLVNPIAKNVTLLGCPKIFIINACRGAERNLYVSDSRYPEMEVDSCSACLPSNENKMRGIPYMKEILKLYSCYEGSHFFNFHFIIISITVSLRICVIS